MPNALAHETSPYLLQHAHNPVDWFPWGDAAIERARAEDKPIFLSIGYSACHWCHVMERESFENETIAAFLNAHFVSIKVDREERPDLDDIYMSAVVALNGQGGWPMSVFLTADLKPFYGGTYYPPTDHYGRPGFLTLLNGLLNAWQHRRDEIHKNAEGLTDYVSAQLSAMAEGAGSDAPPPVSLLDAAVKDLKQTYDATHGGWGGAPKFPSGMTIGLLLREYRRTGNRDALAMATHTLDRMASGGMYDLLGGGFARYSVDEEWLVPHFEKMLYDNAQLAQAYIEAWQLTGTPRYAQVARETLDYVLRDLRDPLGGFHSAEDADSEHEEGKFYLWRKAEIVEILGAQDAEVFCRAYGIEDGGNFHSHEPYHQGLNVLRRAGEADDARLVAMRDKLLEVRSRRVRPGLDDKVLTSWNGLMISSFCHGAQAFGEPRYAQAAAEAGRFLLEHQWRDGTLLRTHRRGESRLPGYLDDYAFLANGFVDLYETTFDPAWLDAARDLVDAMLAKFWDEATGAFFFTGDEHKHLIARTRPSYDGAEPSGNSVAVLALLRLASLLERPDYEAHARRVLAACGSLMARAPRGYLKLLWGLHWLHVPPVEIALVGEREAALAAIGQCYIPNRVIVAPPAVLPLLEGKTTPAVYFCRNHACDAPLETIEALAAYIEREYPRST